MAQGEFDDAIVGAGVHSVKAQARMALNTTVQTGEVEARCTIGKGSMSVEEVRLVKGMQIEFLTYSIFDFDVQEPLAYARGTVPRP